MNHHKWALVTSICAATGLLCGCQGGTGPEDAPAAEAVSCCGGLQEDVTAENAYSVSDLGWSLSSLSGDTFRFDTGGLGDVPLPKSGDLIIGLPEDGIPDLDAGFLRRVTDVSQSGNLLSLGTTDASLLEIVPQCALRQSVAIGLGDVPLPSPWIEEVPAWGDPIPEHAILRAQGIDLSGLEFSDSIEWDSAGTRVTVSVTHKITEGRIVLTNPIVEVQYVAVDSSICDVRASVRGHLVMDLEMETEIRGALEKDLWEKSIFDLLGGQGKPAKKTVQRVGKNLKRAPKGIPFVSTFDFDIKIGFAFDVGAAANFKYGVHAESAMLAGARYCDGAWLPVEDGSLGEATGHFDPTVVVEGGLTVFVRPEVIWKLVGGAIKVTAWVKPSARASARLQVIPATQFCGKVTWRVDAGAKVSKKPSWLPIPTPSIDLPVIGDQTLYDECWTLANIPTHPDVGQRAGRGLGSDRIVPVVLRSDR